MSQKIINQALDELNKKNINKSQSILLKLLKKELNNTKALTLLSIIKFQYEKNLIDALKYSVRAVELRSQDVNSYIIAGISAMQLDKHLEANKYLKSGYQINNQNRDILFNLALNYAELENYEKAIDCYEKCIAINSNDFGSKLNLANIYRKIDQDNKAEKIYLDLLPLDKPIIYKNYLSLLFKKHDHQKALEIAKKICDIENTTLNLIEYLRASIGIKDLDLSEQLLEEINLPHDKEYQYLYISHLLNLGLYEKALSNFESFFNPLNSNIENKFITLYCILLGCVDQENDVDSKFKSLLSKNIYQNIDKQYSLWLLSKNKIKEGFSYFFSRLNEKQKEIVKPINLKQADMKGKKILFYGDQGIGDQIFYMRFLKKFRTSASLITLAIDKRLIPIAKEYLPKYTIIAKDEIDPVNYSKDFEIVQYLGDLPRILNVDNNNIGDYEFDEPKKSNKLVNKKARVGIAWNSKNLRLENEKSISIEHIKGIISQSTNEFINLQYDNFKDIQELNEFENFYAYDEIDKKNDLVGLCNLIDACDYVITISNVTAHICGMRHKKTFLLLPNTKRSIWYWNQLDGKKSLWYPTIEVIDLKKSIKLKIKSIKIK